MGINKLSLYRKKRGLSQAELGSIIGVTQQTISSYEKGVAEPSVIDISILLELFGGITFDELFGYDNFSVYIHEDNNKKLSENIDQLSTMLPGNLTDYEKKSYLVNRIIKEYFEKREE